MVLLKSIYNFIKSILIILFITFSITLVIDFFFGELILDKLDPYLSKTDFYERLIRVDHKFYHHTLKENVKQDDREEDCIVLKSTGVGKRLSFIT